MPKKQQKRPLKEHLADRFRTAYDKWKRDGYRRTAEDLADKIGVDKSSITVWKKGRAFPTYDKLPQVSEALGVTLTYWFEGY